jgi:hypothetical protein
MKWYQSLKLCSVCEEKVSSMPPRRHAEPLIENQAVEREMRDLCESLDAMETTQRRAPDARDVNDAERKEREFEEAT